MNTLIGILKKYDKAYRFVQNLRFFQYVSLFRITGGKKKYPRVIQLPITYNCNSKCVMCNIWKMDHSNEATIDEFTGFMKDELFKEVVTVGINGGEPSLVTNLPEYANEILKLPKIKGLNIISHGFSKRLLTGELKDIYQACKMKNVGFHVAISLDGVGEVHNTVRGKKKAFDQTLSTIREVADNQSEYCDSYDLGCTVVAQNIYNLVELDEFACINNFKIKYRLGIDNKRIESDLLRNQYTVLDDFLRQSAKEFFHYQMSRVGSIKDKFKYYAIFNWLNNEVPERMLGCAWKDEGVTLDSRGELYYCAVASKSIGSLRHDKGVSAFFSEKNIEYRKSIIDNNCNDCIHDYTGRPELKYVIKFIYDLYIKRRLSMYLYYVRAKFL